MTMLARWDPFRELEDMHNRLSSFFSRAPARWGWAEGGESLSLSDWSPAVDIIEDDKEYLIKAELPELRKEEVKVKVENGVLSISGERKFEQEQKGRKYHRVERAYGAFERSFSLPEDAVPGQVKADFTDGVLRVHLAKTPTAKPKALEVKVS